MQFAIREWSGAKLAFLNAVSFLVTVALLTYLGPFGTWALPPFSERLPFWLTTVGANWIVGYIAFYVIPPRLRERRGGVWLGFVLAAAGAALPGTGTAWLAVTVYLDYRPSSVSELATLYGQVFVLHLIIGSIVFRLIDGALRSRNGTEELPMLEEGVGFAPPLVAEATLLSRLPARSRAELLHLRMQDHYVEVHTAAGSEMLLLRFRDALSEVEGVNGLQVHRSHWVARNAVAGVERRSGGRIALRLVNGSRVPVSRSFAPLLRSRGWI
ncbi:MAG: LytTR family DNA-binding domain-containing protein [Thiotrichales bacterium]|nr:LytTR family DNA-binding domain-containing protein [Thiotrichales bacterium]MCY4350765.1 LytTR family DNA-binding domain-containing protein [Thiotrichales bacterium]